MNLFKRTIAATAVLGVIITASGNMNITNATSDPTTVTVERAAIPYAEQYKANSTPPWTNDCLGWARMLQKEGIVHDSHNMHAIGCWDGPWANAHYRANPYFEGCGGRARYYARLGWFAYPRTVMALVKRDMPWCTIYEDGSYEDNSTH